MLTQGRKNSKMVSTQRQQWENNERNEWKKKEFNIIFRIYSAPAPVNTFLTQRESVQILFLMYMRLSIQRSLITFGIFQRQAFQTILPRSACTSFVDVLFAQLPHSCVQHTRSGFSLLSLPFLLAHFTHSARCSRALSYAQGAPRV